MKQKQPATMADNFKPLILISFLTAVIGAFGYYSSQVNAEPVHPQVDDEHSLHTDMRAMDLVKLEDVTHETVASGKWKNPATWKNGAIPGDGARVLINKGHSVNLTHQPASHLMTLRVDGTLNFNRRKNTRLVVDTLVSSKDSLIQMGTESRPISANRKASIVIKDWNQGFETTDTLSPDYDPSKVGQGVIIHGRFVAVGAEKTPYVVFNGASAGDTYLHLEEFPVNWRSGDTIVIAGTSKDGLQAEERTIVSVDSAAQTISLNQALTFSHQTPEHTIENLELKIHVANLSRNVSIETDESGRAATEKVRTSNARNNYGDAFNARGHVMFMHTNDIVAKYAGFYHLGRTNKLISIQDSEFSDTGETLLVGKNPRARYSLHFHRAGSDSAPGIIDSCAVISSPGWGYVNHSSNVEMTSNVAYKVTGASFITEAGDEVGTFVSNLAIETRARGRTAIKEWLTRNHIGDWGFLGHAFWFNGVYVDVINNIANGSSNYAYGFARTAIDNVTTVNTLNGEKPFARVTLKTFSGNQAYGNSGGVLASWGGNESNVLLFSDTLAFSNSAGGNGAWINWWYPESIKFNNVTMINDINNPDSVGLANFQKLHKTTIINPRIEGFGVGIVLPQIKSQNLISGGYLNNISNLKHRHGGGAHEVRTVINGDMKFGTLSPAALNGEKQVKVKMLATVRQDKRGRILNHNRLYFDIDGENGAKRLYADIEQAADYIAPDGIGLTNQQRADQGLRIVGGEIWPVESVVRDDMQNVRAIPATIPD